MTPYAVLVIEQVAAKHAVDPSQILSRSRVTRLLAARVEIAQRLTAERCYSTAKIGKILGRDHTVIVYYLGRANKKAVIRKLRWRKPHIAHLNNHNFNDHDRCQLCFTGSRLKPAKPPKPQKRYLKPYAGADCDYVWKELPQCKSSDA